MNDQEVGYVVKSRDFLVYLDGFPKAHINDMVESDTGARGWINSVSTDQVEVLMLDESSIAPKQMFKKLPKRLGLPVGNFLLGRSINPLGLPIDGKGPLSTSKDTLVLELEQTAPGIESRQFIDEQFLTGVTLIDTLIPLGKGQRELVMGDAHSGKTSFLIDLILNQKGSGTICIYASIGKPAVTVRNLIDVLRVNNALAYTVVIATSSSEPAPLIFLTPKAAMTVAEYFQRLGKNVLVILDDMGSHAKVYREIALLGNKPPGRESYPGDIFYQHAHLLERAGNFNKQFGGGSITALPIIEINLNDFTTLIPTNLMSMTDGHLLFRSSLHNQGQRPAVDIFVSVSRVGRQTQDRVINSIAARVREILTTAQDLETISRFSSELSAETQLTLRRRDLIDEIIKQEPFSLIPKEVQAVILSLVFTSFLADKNRLFIEKYKNTLIEQFLKNPTLLPITQSVSRMQSDQQLISTLEQTAVPILLKLLR